MSEANLHHIAHSAIHHIDEVDASFCKGSNSYEKTAKYLFRSPYTKNNRNLDTRLRLFSFYGIMKKKAVIE